jgi:hypothetical protein
LSVTGIDAVAQIILEGLLTALHVAHGSLPHLLRILAGILHIVVAKLADHWFDLSGWAGACQANKGERSGFRLLLHPFLPRITVIGVPRVALKIIAEILLWLR